ncbi:MAG: hypothetical protein ABI763_11900 [Bacteroidota bacterium]
MPFVKHRFSEHNISPRTEILIIGTFNPETPNNSADFFYGRKRNYLWQLLPAAFGHDSLKSKSIEEKKNFLSKYFIDFVDLICEVDVEEGHESNYEDKYIDSRITKWKNVVDAIKELKYLKRVAFTRKTLTGIPKISKMILEVKQYCDETGISFQFLMTPARTYSAFKQNLWTDFFINGK